MGRNRILFWRIIVAAVVAVILLPYRVLYADVIADNRQPVHVGVVLQTGIAMPGSAGVYYGFDAEYMYKIGQYANFKVVYHPFVNNDGMFQALRDHNIQMALGISPNQERLEEFLFANNGFFTGQASIRVRSDDPRFSYGNPAEFNDKVLGVVQSSIMYDRAVEWAEKSNITPIFKFYDSDEAMHEAMDAGKLDGVITIGSKFTQNYRSAFNIATNTYYPIFNKNEVDLKNKVDAAMNRIMYEDPLYSEKLFDKYRHFQIHEGLPLTKEEWAYIAEHPVLKVGVIRQQAPFSYVDDDGELRGISPDLYRRISQLLDWPVAFVICETRQELIDALHSGDVDVYGVTTQDIIASEESGLALTKTFFHLSILSIKRADVNEIKTAGFVGRVPQNVEKAMRENLPDVKFKGYYSLEDCYDAMVAHEVDAIYCNMAQLNWLTLRRGTGNFVVEGIDNLESECSAQLLPQNGLLNSILSKTVQGNNIDVTSIISQNIYIKPTTMEYLRTIPNRLVAIFFSLLLLLTIAVSFAVYKSHQRQVLAELSAKQAALDASEQARRSESNFLSTMSHDMRTPLNGILGYTRLAKGSGNMEEVQQYLERIDSSSKLMLALVNDVLDLSKLASGKMELREERIVPHELFNIIKDAITMNANNQHITFTANLHVDEGIVVYADRLRLQQLAMNLLSNAVKYTPAGGHVDWQVFVHANGDDSSLEEIVKDDGIGMSKEFQQHMFDIFSQEVRQETLHTRGTGLGLSLVNKFISMMGGTIKVDSELNKGSTFRFTVPIRTVKESAEEAATANHASAINTNDIPRDLLKDVPILLVEDNSINAELTNLMLAEYGANIIDWAHNGQEALEFYSASETSHYQLILMDLRMPVMGGLAATRKIRTLHRADASLVPIIAMSADAYEEDIQNCIEAGMQKHISKPVDINVLIRAIAEVLKPTKFVHWA
ncbi:ATP-binding protein [uncultured Anaerovibrio sp.]|uniref:ATP-binding protein n=1 Tax=uncultured Anaerovibrio sp. TaxID=361586 RepID=UPI002610DAE9|nr:transporter substrate-binding domain-containing protein [uncultured Anaerovibrio sp.]